MTSKKKKTAKTTKPQPVEPVAAEETPVPEAVVPAAEVQDPVEPVLEPETVPQEAEAPVSEAGPEAAPEAETQQAEAAPVNSKPFTAALRDPRLPPVGATITRQYKGTVIEVTVTETGFEYEGTTYSSISKVAAAVTGARAVNGMAFFRLGVVPGGKSPRSGAGTARLAAKINKIEGLVVKLRGAIEAGQEALVEAEGELAVMKERR